MDRRGKPKKAKARAKRPLARKPPKDDAAKVRDLEKRLAEALKHEAEALEQVQTRDRELVEAQEERAATAEILGVISRSPSDVQPVFEVVLASGVRLCRASFGGVFRFDGELIHLVTSHEWPPEHLETVHRRFPMPPGDGSLAARAIRDRHVVQTPDYVANSRAGGWPEWVPGGEQRPRSTIAIPMLREGSPLGAIVLARAEPGLFSDKHIALLQTFADQAVIAIENVRLFHETQEALERQTASSEILRVIAGSPTDVQPVFATIMKNALRLCSAQTAAVLTFDGHLIHAGAFLNIPADAEERMRRRFPRVPDRSSAAGRAILTGEVAEVPDVEADPDYVFASDVRASGLRSNTAVPMLRDGRAIGTINLGRTVVGRFSESEIALLKTFADQAVIAIENVRLFTELQEKNRALTEAHAQVTEALEQQTATSEILRVISSSPTELQPVFDTIVSHAVKLCAAAFGGLQRIDGDRMTLDAQCGVSADELALLQRDVFPLPISRESATGRAVVDRAIVHIHDIRKDPEFAVRRLQSMQGFRTILAVPMLREGVPIGALALWRREVRPFSDTEIGLVQTFASQAVIAIENARLLGELRARTDELTRSVDQLTALGEVSRAVSSTLDLETVLTTIVARAVQLTGVDGGVVFEYDEAAEEFELRASTGQEALDEVRRRARFRKGEGVVGRTAIAHEPVQVADITRVGTYVGRLRESLIEAGVRALLAIPMLREGHLIGSLVVNRNTPGDFPPETVDLLRTFATQSALAIQNARLFQEVEDKGRELEAASRHKSEFLANMSHELRTPLNAIIGFSEVLLERMFGEINEKQTEYLQDILSSGQHLLSLINDILDLSKIEAGRMELALAPFHLPQALENALILVRERAARHGIALTRDVDPRLGELVGDERKVKQVLLNLLSNAVKFTPEGGRISLTGRLTDGGVEISVSDSGVGIAQEDQETIFEEFRQVGGDYTRKQEGTGLGLTLTKKFVEMHGGRIWVESGVGRGSTFTFTLPIGQAHSA